MIAAKVHPQDVDLVILLPSRLFGGAERTIMNLLEGMQHLPGQPNVTLLAHADVVSPHLPNGGAVELIDIASWMLDSTLNSLPRVRRDAQVLNEYLASRLTRHRRTVVLCFLHYGAAIAVWLKWLFRGDTRIRVIASPRGPSALGIPMITHERWKRLLWHAHIAAAGRICDAVVVPSDGMQLELTGRYHATARRVRAIANSYPNELDAVWTEQQAMRRQDGRTTASRFVMATRLSSEKNVDLAVRAFVQHVTRFPHDTLTIVGDGPARTELEALIDRHGIAQQVQLVPFMREPFRLIAEHDVYIHTCLIEGFGNSMLEALALGLPIVATDCDFGPRQLVMHGINGLLTPVCDEYALSAALVDIKNMVLPKLQLAARESAKMYSNFLMAARYVDEFCKV